MADLKALAEHKTALRKSTPKFVRRGAAYIKRLDAKWRKPRGFHSKVRKYKKGKPRMAAIGFKTPVALQGVLRSGHREHLVSSVEDLKKVDPKTELAVLSSTVGRRKTVEIIAAAKKLGISFSNLKPEEKEKEIKAYLDTRKKVKRERADKAKARREKEKAAQEKDKKKKKEDKKDEKSKSEPEKKEEKPKAEVKETPKEEKPKAEPKKEVKEEEKKPEAKAEKKEAPAKKEKSEKKESKK